MYGGKKLTRSARSDEGHEKKKEILPGVAGLLGAGGLRGLRDSVVLFGCFVPSVSNLLPFVGLGVLGITNGQNKGDITLPDERSWAFLGKVGVDHTFAPELRVRLTASTYQNDNAGRATLFWGDRAGAAYWGVLDNGKQAQHWNGRVNPNFTEEIRAYQINPFVEVGGVELFGVVEMAEGRTTSETDMRSITQYAADAVYRFLDDRLYVGGRYNTVTGELFTRDHEQTVDRYVLGGGWFLTPNVLLKGEYVNQTYDGFDRTSILSGGKFNGVVLQGVVSF